MHIDKEHEEIVVAKLPKCMYCDDDAHYDAKTIYGFWANMCFKHWKVYAYSKKLGLGIGQNLITKK
jgi:hypothetical protein